MTYPLERLRVLDMSQAVSGPYCGRLLSDLGADVVKVCWPRADVTNSFGLRINGVSGLYTQMNAGKRGVAADLTNELDIDLLRKLATRADVVIENFRPGVLEKVRLQFSELTRLNPHLIMLSISGFGRSGADANRQAYAPVIHAESGLLGRQAALDNRPATDLAIALADSITALHGTIAVLAALEMRHQTGSGQHIDISMLDATLATDDYAHHAIDRSPIQSPARGEIWDAPEGPIMIAADRMTTWKRLSEAFGLIADEGDALESKIAARHASIRSWLLSFSTRSDLIAALSKSNLAWADVRNTEEAFAHAAALGRRLITTVDDRNGQRRGVVRSPYRFSGAECDVRGPAPDPAQDDGSPLLDWLGEVRSSRITGDQTPPQT